MSCCIIGCPNEGSNPSKSTTYHLFPHPEKDRNRFIEWVAACSNNTRIKMSDPITVHKRYRVCRRHFDSDCLNGGCRRLLNTAVPTLHLNPSFDDDEYRIGIKSCVDNELVNDEIEAAVDDITFTPIVVVAKSDRYNRDQPDSYSNDPFDLIITNDPITLPTIQEPTIRQRRKRKSDLMLQHDKPVQSRHKYSYLNEIHSSHLAKKSGETLQQKVTQPKKPNTAKENDHHEYVTMEVVEVVEPDPLLEQLPRLETDIEYELLDVEDEKFYRAPLTDSTLKKWREDFYNCEKNILAQNVCSRIDPFDVCLSRKALENTQHVFTYKVESEGKPLTNQKNSGRCWIFAALNSMRIPFMKQYNLDEFEFSQGYLFYWDKIERCNFFLHSIVETAEKGEEVTGRLLSFLLHDPTSDGGQWDMLVNLVNKHGLMPKKCFPESYSCEASVRLNAVLKSKLREYTKILRDLIENGASEDDVKAKLHEQMGEIYRVVGICLGIPDDKFKWEYYDKSKAYQCVGPIKPIDFYEKYVKPCFNVDDKVCIVSDPRSTSAYGQAYTVEYLGNVVGGRPVLYNNQPVELLMELVTTSLKNSEPVWFGCEVSKRFAGKQGIEDLTIHDFKLVFGVDIQITLSKGERLMYGESAMTHAMTFTAVSCDDNGTATKFRVENSWGEDRGEKGYLIMSADWFKEFVFEVVVDKSIVPKEVLQVFDQYPIVLPAWDPMGTLAKN